MGSSSQARESGQREWQEPRPRGQPCRALGVATQQGEGSNCARGWHPSWPGSCQQTVLVRDTRVSHPTPEGLFQHHSSSLASGLDSSQTNDRCAPGKTPSSPCRPPQQGGPAEEPGMGPLAETENPAHSSASSLPFSIFPAGAKPFPRLTAGGRRCLSVQVDTVIKMARNQETNSE